MTRKRWLWSAAVLLGAGAVVAALILPSSTFQAWLRGEAFLEGRPTTYWREVLRADGQAGQIRPRTQIAFEGDPEVSVPVLERCLADSDPTVRWPAVRLLGCCILSDRALQAIRTALQDSDRHVRFEAILALRGHGLASRPLAPDLINMLQDADPQVRFIADFVLWQIDAPLAVKAGGWVPFSSRPWGFSAMFPAKPEEEEGTTEIQDNLVTVHSFAASHGTMRFMVGISEYPPEGDSVPLDQWYDTVRDYALTGLGGRLLRETSLEVNGHKGREKEVEVQGKGVLRSRLFRVNGRLYQALVAYDPKFLNSAAVACFLDSFRLEHDGD